MKYYVVADVHGYYDYMVEALQEKGFFEDKEPHKLVVCGDIYDRGPQNKEVENFVAQLLDKDEIILIRGNHEDLLMSFIDTLPSLSEYDLRFSHSYTNGTVDTVREIVGASMKKMILAPQIVSEQFKKSLTYTKIIPAMLNYYETERYIFVHGWIPATANGFGGMGLFFEYDPKWREANNADWTYARWYNGMLAAHQGVVEAGKIIVCGHWHCSFGHAHYEENGSEFGKDADFSPYYGDGIIALDACTIQSKKVNCIVINDKELKDDCNG
ncbi:MAG: metallophosphoesterase [Clostridia bacterium]|uniref:metallophosphoesterase n=1 Tax=Pumilibacter muris TaxID=2941510 RepID=UPI0020409219|nr:metallophosphoesterase [Pumilibacter muris]MCX4363147.1 metallophosphoesterase [Clostridia bacterium]